jgi:hypothetical protein
MTVTKRSVLASLQAGARKIVGYLLPDPYMDSVNIFIICEYTQYISWGEKLKNHKLLRNFKAAKCAGKKL